MGVWELQNFYTVYTPILQFPLLLQWFFKNTVNSIHQPCGHRFENIIGQPVRDQHPKHTLRLSNSSYIQALNPQLHMVPVGHLGHPTATWSSWSCQRLEEARGRLHPGCSQAALPTPPSLKTQGFTLPLVTYADVWKHLRLYYDANSWAGQRCNLCIKRNGVIYSNYNPGPLRLQLNIHAIEPQPSLAKCKFCRQKAICYHGLPG